MFAFLYHTPLQFQLLICRCWAQSLCCTRSRGSMGGLSIAGASLTIVVGALLSGWWELRPATPTVVAEALPAATGPLVTVSGGGPADCHCHCHVNQSAVKPAPPAYYDGAWIYAVLGTLGVQGALCAGLCGLRLLAGAARFCQRVPGALALRDAEEAPPAPAGKRTRSSALGHLAVDPATL